MFDNDFGTTLSRLRIQQRLSQEELAAGIMSRENLSLIETGKRNPTAQNVLALFERLGYTADQFISQVPNLREINSVVLREMFRDAQAYNDKDTMTRVLGEMDKSDAYRKGIFLQFKLRCRAIIAWKYEKDIEKAQEILFEAIGITIPHFNEERAHECLLGHCDIEVLKLIADIYFENGRQRKAIKLLKNMVKAVKTYYISSYNQARAQCFIQYQLANYLGKIGKNKKALRVCEEALERAQVHRLFELLPLINFNKACALYYTGKDTEAKELIIQVHACYVIHGKKDKASEVEDFAAIKMGLDCLKYNNPFLYWEKNNDATQMARQAALFASM